VSGRRGRSGATSRRLRQIGVRNVLIETDIPHPTCHYPNPKEHFVRVLSGLDDDAKRRVLQDNGAELYNIPLPS
jgi:uncharacterized protein